MNYSYSTDQVGYHGTFGSVEKACDEAAKVVGVHGTFWVGERVAPPQPEIAWYASDWLEHVSVQDEYSGDWAESWDSSTKEQREELETKVRKVMAAWLDRHDLRPKFWNIKNPRRFFVAAKSGDVYEIESV